MEWGTVIGGLVTIFVTLLGYFFTKKSDSDKARDAVTLKEAQKETARLEQLSKDLSEVEKINLQIDAQAKLDEDLRAKARAELLSQK